MTLDLVEALNDIYESIEEGLSKLGSGGRFKKLTKKLAHKGVRDPKALAAHIGRKKWGKKKFQSLAAHGRK